MYEIIEKNQYGVLVKNTTNYGDCFFCKYEITQCNNRYKCINDSYYLPDSEAEKLESENQLMNTTIDDLYIESKCYFEVKKKLDDTQKELIDLRVENKQLKERVKELEGTIDNNVTELIDSQYSSIIGQWMITKCCNFLIKDNFNYCPNCGRKIKK
jgi:hypothetical protein